MGKIEKKCKEKKVLDVNSNLKFMKTLWNLGTVLEFITIPLYFAAMKNRAITYEWFVKLREFEYIEVVYCSFAAATMFVFSILVMMNRKRERGQDMFIALMCFIAQVIMLAWFITA
jgi:uncharacterized membrane protein YhaH (DUF805 family)